MASVSGPGSAENQSSPDSGRTAADATGREETELSLKDDGGLEKLNEQNKTNDQVNSVTNRDDKEDDSLDELERYNREVQGAEADTTLDDLLESNKVSLNDTEIEFTKATVKLVEITKLDATNVNGYNGVSGNAIDTVHDHIIVEHLCTDNEDNGKECNEEIIAAENSRGCLEMPETREETEGSMSPSLMFAMCRYRWEKTIVTQSDGVVFVTLNNKVSYRSIHNNKHDSKSSQHKIWGPLST